jgi:hypothetical protein
VAKLDKGAPKGIFTLFGWAVVGRIPSSILKSSNKKTEMRCLAVGIEIPDSVSFVEMAEISTPRKRLGQQ